MGAKDQRKTRKTSEYSWGEWTQTVHGRGTQYSNVCKLKSGTDALFWRLGPSPLCPLTSIWHYAHEEMPKKLICATFHSWVNVNTRNDNSVLLLQSYGVLFDSTMTPCHAGFLSALYPRGVKMRLYELLGGKYVSVYKACGNLGGSGACSPGKFDFGPFIGRNLVESGTVFAWT